ncbi:helix-turn-helix transcriptional regulator [uncultured Bilophila sp.]|uniref:helix-turn-helix domain-containing protein n=1 Tax=uncultured Bilophila sp. TaxID=529385 RepID=UPI00280A7106|nr:helix-turn-helix transcriptional regulator [uncultured Bilophila sp.]
MSKKSSPCPFGKILVIVSAREQRGITQYRLAQLAGRSIRQISQIERGEREPKLSTLILLAHALGMEPGILVNEAAKVMRIQQDPIEAVAGTVRAKSV